MMWKFLTLYVFLFVFSKTDAQMTQYKFKKHFVVKSTWLLPQWTNNAKRY
jgi:hypothetical protein